MSPALSANAARDRVLYYYDTLLWLNIKYIAECALKEETLAGNVLKYCSVNINVRETLLSYCDNALHKCTALLYDVELYLQQGRLSYKRFVVMKVINIIKTLTSPMCLPFQWKHLQ